MQHFWRQIKQKRLQIDTLSPDDDNIPGSIKFLSPDEEEKFTCNILKKKTNPKKQTNIQKTKTKKQFTFYFWILLFFLR